MAWTKIEEQFLTIARQNAEGSGNIGPKLT
jgi:hypothetical protein